MVSSPQWYFDLFRLDSDNARLWRGDQSIALTLKALGVLHYLVTHAGQLVTKEALLDALWPNTAVSDAALRVVIRELRKALGDTAHAPQFIATVHRLGYRFLAPVCRVDPPADGLKTGPPSSPASPASADPTPGEHTLVTALCGVLLTASVLGAELGLGDPHRLMQLASALCSVLLNANALGAEVGLSDPHRLMQLASDLPLREVQQWEGNIQHGIGSGILALLGPSVAEEGHVQRSTLAEFGLQLRPRER